MHLTAKQHLAITARQILWPTLFSHHPALPDTQVVNEESWNSLFLFNAVSSLSPELKRTRAPRCAMGKWMHPDPVGWQGCSSAK